MTYAYPGAVASASARLEAPEKLATSQLAAHASYVMLACVGACA